MKSGKRYNKDFKKMIVELYHSGSLVSDLKREYGMSDVLIYRWIKDYRILIEKASPLNKGGDESIFFILIANHLKDPWKTRNLKI